MSRPAKVDKRYLEPNGNKWRVTIGVPLHLKGMLGTRLKQSLGTDSLSEARALRWAVVAKLKAAIAEADAIHRRRKPGPGADAGASNEFKQFRDAVLKEAAAIASATRHLSHDAYSAMTAHSMNERYYAIAGAPVRHDFGEDGERIEVFDPQKERLADEFLAVAAGARLPVDICDAEFKTNRLDNVTSRTEADHDRALERLIEWLTTEHRIADIRDVKPAHARGFVLHMEKSGKAPRTLKKYLTRLRAYFDYVVENDHIEINPWNAAKVKVPAEPATKKERPFTETEIAKLFMGNAKQKMMDLMMMAALTGARLDAIVDLKVGDIIEGKAICFKVQKREQDVRYVPIHAALDEIIERRTAGKKPGDDLFPEFPPTGDPNRERSFAASKQFTTYRRGLGVDDRVPGKRRSRVNFHSFRRWFCSKAYEARVPLDIISGVVGHAQKSITLQYYIEGPSMQAARDCVTSVLLPPLDGSPIVERQPMFQRLIPELERIVG